MIPDFPGRVALVEFLKALLVLEGVHALPETGAFMCQQRTLVNQSLKRLPHQLVPWIDIAEDFSPKHEEASLIQISERLNGET